MNLYHFVVRYDGWPTTLIQVADTNVAFARSKVEDWNRKQPLPAKFILYLPKKTIILDSCGITNICLADFKTNSAAEQLVIH